jgi:hypothetical protein
MSPFFLQASRSQVLISNEGILVWLLSGRAQSLVLISILNLLQRRQGNQKTNVDHIHVDSYVA